jgi:hypothetical protein
MSGPLTQFQATKPTQREMLALVTTLNKALGDAAVEVAQVESTFELVWPKLKEAFDHLPEDGPEQQPERRPEDMLKELVTLTRQTSLNVLESHRAIMEKIHDVEARQAYVGAMIPADTTFWSVDSLSGKSEIKKVVQRVPSELAPVRPVRPLTEVERSAIRQKVEELLAENEVPQEADKK